MNYTLLIPNKGAESRLSGIKQKKIQIIPLNLDLDLLFMIREAEFEPGLLHFVYYIDV